MRRLLTSLLCLVLAAPAAAEPLRLPEMGDPASLALSESEERALGDAIMEELRRKLPMEQDPQISGYLSDLGRRLASRVYTEQELRFFVVDDPAINAFALPGGYIGINTGLILNAGSESELASVVAHEIAHVSQRHIARRIAAAENSTWRTAALLTAAILIGSQSPQAGSAAAMAGVAGSIQQQLNYSRQHEQEADRVGMRILADAGLDPRGMPRFFERLLQQSRYQDRPPEYLSTHPVTESRVSDTRARADSQPRGDIFENDDFQLMRARLAALKAQRGQRAAREFRARLAEAEGLRAHALRYGLALLLIREGEHAEAEGLLRQLLDEHGERAAYFAALGELKRAAGDTAQSLAHYREGLSLYPDDAGLGVGYARSLEAAGRSEQAWKQLEQLHRRQPLQADTLRDLARLADAAGHPVDARLAMARHYYMGGDLRAALTQLDAVLNSAEADRYQKERAAAYREQWRRAAERARDS
ncbi:M48 family metalloprotease [Alkalilimnicola sp. S0819]|uniref:M48 family metalloprotease n=1 Tax=Alkalilimnicola sp. S0819 TaxID=2613922 RepID=UPI001869ECE5|nr:M48 family metalloprotease [Alkalilimnicola sp. S0819]